MTDILVQRERLTEALSLLNHPSLDGSDEVNRAYNIIEDEIDKGRTLKTAWEEVVEQKG